MKTIRRKLDEIDGIDLISADKKVLKGGVGLDVMYNCYWIGTNEIAMSGLCSLGEVACDLAFYELYGDIYDCVPAHQD